MELLRSSLVTELRTVIAELGRDGGQMSPSVYDTAQALRFSPPRDAQAVLDWLLQRQSADGGWGDPLIPLARDTPTLATLLALLPYRAEARVARAIAAGETWLLGHNRCWEAPLGDGLPVGVELILPRLLVDAARAGLRVSSRPYIGLIELGERRRRLIARLPAQPGTTIAHSWEAWGSEPDPALIDAYGSIGHSPAATAAWLYAARDREDLARERAQASAYLVLAAEATGAGIPGVVPTAWPITRFEQSNALYALLLADLLDHPALQDVVAPQIADLAQVILPTGIGFTDYFDTDGDDTAMALAVVRAAGHAVTPASLRHFAAGGHYCAYHGELQPSASVVAHAIHALSFFGAPRDAEAEAYLAAHQSADGRWIGDKWNASWLYTTSHALVARRGAADAASTRAVQALLAAQAPSGGWGAQRISAEETAYGVIALNALSRTGRRNVLAERASARGEAWLTRHVRPNQPPVSACWQAKEIFRPFRLARTYELAAALQSVMAKPVSPRGEGRGTWTTGAF